MKNIVLAGLIITLQLLSCAAQHNENITPLFNGKDLSNWTMGEEGGFEVINGEIITSSLGKGDDLFTEKRYCNFVLSLEYMLSEVGNSGILIRCDPQDPWKTGTEVQLLAPWTPWRDDLHCTGSIYGHVAVTNRPDETTGIWHKMEIRCDRNIIRISVDNAVTTLASIDTVKTMEDKFLCGAIGLQVNHANTEGQYAKFRNIYVRDLDVEPEYVSVGFYEKETRLRSQAYDAAVSLGAKMVEPLATMMSGYSPVAKSGSKQVLFDIAARATALQSEETYKNDVAIALKINANSTSSEITRNYLNWLSGMIND